MTSQHRSDNPFPGLRSFTPEEDYLFFGREEQTMELLQTLGTHRFVAVVGTSGRGKSSLVRCGLLSQLLGGKMLQAGTVWEVAVTHPGAAPLGHLAEALLAAGLYDATEEDAKARLLATLNRSHAGLVEAIRQARLGDNVNFLLVVDQFEEIFRFNRGGSAQREAASEFVSLLLHTAAQKEVPIYIVLTMRSDFIGDCAQFEDLAEAVNRGEYLIPRMTREQFKQAIEGPVRVAGGSITPRLLQRVLNDLGDEADQLPCLQHALMRTWDHWKRSSSETHEPEGPFTSEGRVTRVPETAKGSGDSQSSSLRQQAARSLDLEDYDAIGRMHTALSRHADEIYDSLGSDRARRLCTAMFKALTVRESENRGIRRPRTLGRLAQILEVSIEELTPIIDAYRRPGVTFLMPPTSVPLENSTVIDISHESLMRVWVRLRDWVEEEAQSVTIFHRLAESAALQEVGKAGLYRDPELNIALSWREDTQPNAAWAEQYGGGFERTMAYLEQSRAEAEREEKEREAARQRELRQARELAEAQSQRAEAQRRAARRLRSGLVVVAGVALVAVIATVFAIAKKREADRLSTKVSNELYVADMNRAGQAYREGNIGALDALLDRHVLRPEEPDTRPEYHFWRHASRRELVSMGSPTGNPNFRDLAVAPDQKTVATLTWQNVVGIYDVASHQLIKVLSAGAGFPGRLTFSPNGNTLAVWKLDGVDGGVARRWNTQTWEPIGPDLTFPGQDSQGQAVAVSALAYSPDGSLLAAGSDQGQVAIWNRRTRQTNYIFDVSGKFPGANYVQELMFTPNSQRLVAMVVPNPDWRGAFGGGLVVLDAASSQHAVRNIPTASPAVSLDFSPDGRLLVSGHLNGEVNLWDTSTFDDPKRLFKSRGRIMNVCFSPQPGRYLAVSTVEGNAIQVWKMPPRGLPADSPTDPSEDNPRRVATLKGHSEAAKVAFVGNENTLWSAGADSQLNVWDWRQSGLYTEVPDSEFAVGLTYLFGGDRGRLAWRRSQGEDTAHPQQRFQAGVSPSPIQLYDVATAKELPDWNEGKRFYIHASSANGQFLAALSEDRYIRLWKSTNGTLIKTTPEPVQPNRIWELWDLAVANDGKKVVWSDHATHLWNLETDRIVDLPESEGPGGTSCYNFSFAFSPDSTRFAIGGVFPDSSGNFKVRMWDVGAAQPGPPKTISHSLSFALAFAPDGTRLAVGTWDSTIELHNPQTGQPIGDPLVGHAAPVTYLAFCPDGRTFFSGAFDQVLRLWDVHKTPCVQLTTLPELDSSDVNALVMEPKGRWMASGHVGQPARVWRLDPDRDPRRARMLWQEEGRPACTRGNFTKAEEIATQVVQSSVPGVPDQAGGDAWFALAVLAVHQGDLKKFQQIRNKMVTRYRETPYLKPAAYTALVCSLFPPTSSTSDQLQISQQLAERVITNDDAPGSVLDSAKIALILSKYRSGNYAEAVSQANDFAEENPYVLNRVRMVYIPVELALAMSQQHLGKPTEARDTLALARHDMEELNKTYPGTPERPSGSGWNLWMFDTALMHEAEALIGGGK